MTAPTYPTKLLSISSDAKTVKGEKYGWKTAILYLSPASTAIIGSDAVTTICPYSTPGCRESCLFTAGRGRFNSTVNARYRKTRFWLEHPEAFLAQLDTELQAFKLACKKGGFRGAVRLNGTSDILWYGFLEALKPHPDLRFYDYTKAPFVAGWPRSSLWHLTYSLSEHYQSEGHAKRWLANGRNVAVVYRSRALVEEAIERGQVDGDAHDLRFLDPPGSIIALKAKGRARLDKTGFVRDEVWRP